LVSKIKQHRPDLLTDWLLGDRDHIPDEMPSRFLEKASKPIDGIGEPVTACFFTKMAVDPTNWLVQFLPPRPTKKWLDGNH